MTELDSWTAAGPVSTSTVENIDSTNNLPTELYPYRYSDASLTRTPLGQKAPFQRTTATILGHGNNQPDEIQSPWREIDPHRDSPQPPRIRYSQPSPMQHLIRRKRVPSPPSTLKSSSIASGTTDGTSSSVSGSEYGGYVPHGPYTTVRTAEVLYCPISGCNRGPGNIRPFPRREDLLAHLRGVHRAGISSKTNLRSWLIDQGYNPHFL
ncbi:hypothetical protein EV426DRAFT_352970 [Tirmania nivea]|nr:hypothetical protein EV426DRAFT_352970 [Tirmania nivea]